SDAGISGGQGIAKRQPSATMPESMPREGFVAMAAARAKPSATASRSRAARKSAGLAFHLLDRAPGEDVAAYEPAVLAKAAALAEKAVLSHRKGARVISIVTDPSLRCDGRPLTA